MNPEVVNIQKKIIAGFMNCGVWLKFLGKKSYYTVICVLMIQNF